ncbi:hypothetical protein Cgig2_021149 [Carnegiea gigantea]|uniref:NADH dehydrogenase [ubiquinone] 1 alpha subcomplex assembly factor 3 n=1 Tax=Carnegiea gigantea TaxID=171969 RepID=A0A9Q1KY38_9CARY|nr:hypothetical protein Cgig2_021149 [Carnegiea gigantea]
MALRQKAASTLPSLLKVLRQEAPKPHLNSRPLPSLRRTFSLYDQINLIDNVPEDQLRFQEFDDTGFKVNGVKYEGSLICVGNLLMSWSPKKFSEVTPESLSIFQILRPIPEILIIGCGRHIQPVNSELRNFVRSIGMKLEAVDSRNAASTYNILNEEGRIVAAAVLPYGRCRKFSVTAFSVARLDLERCLGLGLGLHKAGEVVSVLMASPTHRPPAIPMLPLPEPEG